MSKIRQFFKELNEAMSKIPDCPSCRGTGEAHDDVTGVGDWTYWKGQKVPVCYQCKGAGKV